ncbi:RusA family crossover junction endodeoxyribonuclease [Rhizobium sp. BK176]|uniref:RusA family crossover junction endodeoxyribonuclease n=1 Tax=Rhizobium sp. BK176 TaxID=2587071 RepID=UPI0021693DAF|nr:RusA family crossover junction endodeoxyribonuclease [Rhizobium sp. BK176]MCS4089517.1 Holliday junction resolvase RusA-like endonuclease [Rhizobium sp. BK176]
MRISVQQAKALGIKVPGAKGTARKAGEPGKAKTKGKNRASVSDYGRQSVRFEIDLPADPQPKERPRTVMNTGAIVGAFIEAKGNVGRFKELLAGRMSHTYTPKNTADYEDLILTHARVAMATAKMQPFECPVKTHVHLVFKGDPDEWPTSPGDGDADNLEKAVLDALNKVVYVDDRLVVRSIRTKSCGDRPRLIVKVSPASRRMRCS